MAAELTYVNPAVVENFAREVLIRVGVRADEARLVATVLGAADRRGIPSHGCARLKGFYVDRIREKLINPVAVPEVVRNDRGGAVVDAGNGLGHPAGAFAMNLAIEKARQHGIGMVAVRNSNHYGIAAWYAQMALAHGMIGITGTNARPSVAPTHGVDAMYGTNPIAIAMPADDECPFVFDAATTIAQRGKVETYARTGKTLPRGWVVGRDGKEKTSPGEVLDGLLNNTAALLPLGGMDEESGSHKGYGFATVVELLSAALQQGQFLRALGGFAPDGSKRPNQLGHFFIAVDISCFTALEDFKRTTGEICRQLRGSTRARPGQEILTAGLKEFRLEQTAAAKGIPLDPVMASELLQLQKELGLEQIALPF